MARNLKLYIVALCMLLPASIAGQSLSAELNEAYYRNSYRQTEQYFHKWLKKSKPANMDTVNDTMRHTYKLFDIYFSPKELHKIGGNAAKAILDSYGKYLLISNRISLYMKDTVYYTPEYIADLKRKYIERQVIASANSEVDKPAKVTFATHFGYPEYGYMNAEIIDSMVEFRPKVKIHGKKVLYLTPEYQRALNLFLGADPNNLARGNFKQRLGDNDINKRLEYINRYIPVRPGRLVDFHINTYPAPYAITFDKGFMHARVDYVIGEQIGFAVFKRTADGWELLLSSITGSI